MSSILMCTDTEQALQQKEGGGFELPRRERQCLITRWGKKEKRKGKVRYKKGSLGRDCGGGLLGRGRSFVA